MKISEVTLGTIGNFFLVLFFLGALLTNCAQGNAIKDLKSSNADLLHFYTVEKARSLELEKRSADRDSIEAELRACLRGQTVAINHLEDIKWQMKVIIDTCPGRVRAPRLPRP